MRLLHLLLLGLTLWFSTGCQVTEEPDQAAAGAPAALQLRALTPQTLDAIARLKQVLPVAADSRVYLRAVPPGTVIKEDTPGGAVLTVPGAPGEYYGFIVDREPDRKLGHPFQLAYVELGGSGFAKVDASWYSEFDAPGEAGAPFTPVARGDEDGSVFLEVTGTGKAVVQDTSQKPSADPAHFNGLTSTPTPDQAHDEKRDDHVSTTPNDCKKIALVIDTGDKQNGFFGKVFGNDPAVADKFAADADKFSGFVRNGGFTVKRISQFWGNKHETLTRSNGNLAVQLQTIIENQAAEFPCVPGDDCCHELFLYVGGHADEFGQLSIYDASGEGKNQLSLLDLLESLKKMPPCVKVIVFLDTCHSGNAIDDLPALCQGHCGLTVVAACNSSETARAYDSATEAFMSENGDLDGDGRFGDFTDRFLRLKMKGEALGLHPARFLCPGQTRMCSTD